MSDGLQKACADLGKALDAKAIADEARGPAGEKAAVEGQEARVRLRTAVCKYRG